MKFTLQPMVATLLALLGLAGCSSPASQSSPESIRDPLGIDRAVNDYYFPNGVPDANGESESTTSDSDADDASSSSTVDNQL